MGLIKDILAEILKINQRIHEGVLVEMKLNIAFLEQLVQGGSEYLTVHLKIIERPFQEFFIQFDLIIMTVGKQKRLIEHRSAIITRNKHPRIFLQLYLYREEQ